MFDSVGSAQGIVLLILGLLALGIQGYALVDAVRRRDDAFQATGNQTKMLWLAILGVCVALGFVSLANPLNIFNLLAIVGAGVYLTKVRPAIQSITGGSGSRGGW